MKTSHKALRIWLWINILALIFMIWLGGVTRLTQSGLSMVDWRPVTGWLPPSTDSQWEKEFEKYKSSPEYIKKNSHLLVDDFKVLYYWEYFHRLMGRIIGLLFFIPLLYFQFKKKIPQKFEKALWIALFLGGLQGGVGWFMVKSGLVDQPQVSHYRLALHFVMALFILGYLYTLYLKLGLQNPIRAPKNKSYFVSLKVWSLLLLLQIIYGAFMAGQKAGHIFNTFPKMGDHWWATQALAGTSLLSSLLNSQVGIQIVHRALAWIIFFFLPYFLWTHLMHYQRITTGFKVFFTLILLQIVIGIGTLVMSVPLAMASAHQIVATLLVLSTIYLMFEYKYFSRTRKGV